MAGLQRQLPPREIGNDRVTIFAQSTQVSHEFARVLVMSEWWHDSVRCCAPEGEPVLSTPLSVEARGRRRCKCGHGGWLSC